MKYNYNCLRMKFLILVLFALLMEPTSAQFLNLGINDFDSIQTPAMGYVVSSGTLQFVNGNSASPVVPTSVPYGVGGSWAWKQEQQSGGVMLTFNNVSTTGYDTAYVTFRLGAFALNGTDAPDASDYVTTSVSINNGTNWYDQIKVTGGGTPTTWPNTASGEAMRVFSTAAVTTISASGTGLGIVTIKVPNTSNQVRVRITLRSSTANERWTADNITVRVKANVYNNASVTALVSPLPGLSSGTHDIKVRIANRGKNVINNVNVEWKLNGISQTPIYWYSPLDTVGGSGASDTVLTLATGVAMSSGNTYVIKAWTDYPNSTVDTFNTDDTINVSLQPLAAANNPMYTTLGIQDFDTLMGPVLPYTLTTGSLTFANGLSLASSSPASSPIGIGGSWAWYQQQQSGGVTLTFNNVVSPAVDTIYATFRLAAFAVNGTDGPDASDYMTVAISTDGGTNWYDQIKITGAGGSTSWAYSASGEASRIFSTAAVTTLAAPASSLSTLGFSTINIRIPNTTNQARIRITLRSSTANERWCVDNVELKIKGASYNNASVTGLISPPANFCAGSYPVKVRIANRGRNIINNVTVYWKLNGITQTSLYWSNPLDTVGGSGPVDTVLTLGSSVTFASGITNLIKAWTSLPNSVADTFNLDDTINVAVKPALNGNYTIGGTTPNYATIADAVSDLNTLGVCGPVTFTVAAGTYSGQLIIGDIPGASNINTITIDGVNPSTRIISAGIGSTAAVILNGSNFLSIKNFSITNTFAGSCAGLAIVSSSTGKGRGCTIKNNIITLPNAYGYTSFGIHLTSNSNGYTTGSCYADSITIDSNTIAAAYYGLYIYGSSSSAYNKELRIRGNIINNSNYMGIYMSSIFNGFEINNNTINMDSLGNINSYALYIESCTNNTGTGFQYISGNKIKNAGGAGFYLYDIGGGIANPTRIYNNMIGGGFRYADAYGIYIYSLYYTEIYHNSVNLDIATTYPEEAALTYDGSANTIIKNNIFSRTANSGQGLVAYFYTSPSGNNVNYNLYYNAASSNLLFRNASTYTNATYHTALAGGDSSFNKAPSFIGAKNLHVSNGCLTGVNLSSVVSTDIDGETRSANPVIGADEIVLLNNNISAEAILSPATPITTGTQDLVIGIRNMGSNSVTSFNITYKLNGGTPITQVWSGTLNTCDTVSVIFTGSNQITLGAVNNLIIYTSNPNSSTDADKTNDTIRTTFFAPLNGTYTIGPVASDFVSFNAAVNALISSGISGPVVFNVRTGTYNEYINITSVIGASASNTITFKSIANHRDSVILTFNHTSTNAVVKLNNSNYINFKSISIISSGTSFGSAFEFTGAASFDSVENCKLTGFDAGIFADQVTGKQNVFKGNLITNGSNYASIYIFGNSGSYPDSMYFENNIIQNTGSYGAYLYYNRNTKFRNNTITGNSYGMYTRYMYDATEITGNKIDVSTGSYGMYMYYTNGSINAKALIANNSILAGSYGLRSYNSYYQMIYHNTIKTTGTYAIYVSYNSTTYSNNEWKNNIIVNTGTGAAGTITITGASNIFDYNLYYTGGTSLFNAYTNLAAWRAASTQDIHSFVYLPVFVSGTLQPNIADPSAWAINGRGIHLPVVDKDINGNPRPTTLASGVPDLGAFQFEPTSIAPTAVASPASPSAGSTQSFIFLGDTIAKIYWDPFTSTPTTITARQYSGARPPLIDTNNSFMYFYTDITAASGTYNYNIDLFYKDIWLGICPNETDLKLAQKSIGTSPWNAYTSSLSTVDSVNNKISSTLLSSFSYFTGTDNNNPLPVHLTEINALKINNNAIVNWVTANEINSMLFVVERSFDGNIFEYAGEVNAQGNSAKPNRYGFTDSKVFLMTQSKIIYYRLKMIDRDRHFEYSKIVSVNVNDILINGTPKVYPNPFKSSFIAEIHSVDKSNLKVQVTDIQGRLLFTSFEILYPGTHWIEVDKLQNYNPGIYFVTFNLNNEFYEIKVVKE